jgi:hypothetical protein
VAEAQQLAQARKEEEARLRFQRQMSVLLPGLGGGPQGAHSRPPVTLKGKDIRVQLRKAGGRWAVIVW